MTEVRVKRYNNRKLYREGKGHITLREVRQMFAGGEKVAVVCEKTGEDLTIAVLGRMIAQDAYCGRVDARALLKCLEGYGGLSL